MVLSLGVASCVSAHDQDRTSKYTPLLTHELVLDAHDWEAIPLQCYAGDTLSGEFIITHNGELFPGDQTEYDNWQLGGIDFFIFDEENYSSWVEGSLAIPVLKHSGIEELTWNIEIPYNDMWYVVYSNDSVFIKEIEVSINHSGQNGPLILLYSLMGLAALLFLIIIIRKKI